MTATLDQPPMTKDQLHGLLYKLATSGKHSAMHCNKVRAVLNVLERTLTEKLAAEHAELRAALAEASLCFGTDLESLNWWADQADTGLFPEEIREGVIDRTRALLARLDGGR